MDNSSRKAVKIGIVIAVIAAIIYGAFAYFSSFVQLTASVRGNPKNTQIKIYESGDDYKVIKNYSTFGESIKLKKGSYKLVFSGDKFKQQDIKVDLSKTDQSIDITPAYSDKILEEMLAVENQAIVAAINQGVPLTNSGYVIADTKLYHLGEWCGARIHIAQTPEEENQNYVDTYRVVLRKTGLKWELVTKTPELTFGAAKNPLIPRDILVDVNKNPDSN